MVLLDQGVAIFQRRTDFIFSRAPSLPLPVHGVRPTSSKLRHMAVIKMSPQFGPGGCVLTNSDIGFTRREQRLHPWRRSSGLNDQGGNRFERQYSGGRVEFDSFLGHAENDATGFVLCDRGRSCIAHFPEPSCTIVSHARHDDAERIASGTFRH